MHSLSNLKHLPNLRLYYFRRYYAYVLCPKGSNCKDKCSGKVLFNLGDQSSNNCKFFEPFKLAQKAWETFKLDKVDWICHLGHTT